MKRYSPYEEVIVPHDVCKNGTAAISVYVRSQLRSRQDAHKKHQREYLDLLSSIDHGVSTHYEGVVLKGRITNNAHERGLFSVHLDSPTIYQSRYDVVGSYSRVMTGRIEWCSKDTFLLADWVIAEAERHLVSLYKRAKFKQAHARTIDLATELNKTDVYR